MEKSAEKRILSYLKKNLTARRQKHTLAVATFARELAHLYGWNEAEAYRAGLAHDAAKEWSNRRLFEFIEKRKVRVPSMGFIRKNSPKLLHAYAGAQMAWEEKWVKTRAAKSAIAAHTLGDCPMSVPQKILYVADYAAPDRRYAGVQKLRALARRDLNRAFQVVFKEKMAYTVAHKKPIHPLANKILESFKRSSH